MHMRTSYIAPRSAVIKADQATWNPHLAIIGSTMRPYHDRL
jgi:hypothetical protein